MKNWKACLTGVVLALIIEPNAVLIHNAHAQEAVKTPATASQPKPLTGQDEVEYLRAFSNYAIAETRAYNAQAQLAAAQVQFKEQQQVYTAAQSTFNTGIAPILKKLECESIDPNNGHPLCVAKPKK